METEIRYRHSGKVLHLSNEQVSVVVECDGENQVYMETCDKRTWEGCGIGLNKSAVAATIDILTRWLNEADNHGNI